MIKSICKIPAYEFGSFRAEMSKIGNTIRNIAIDKNSKATVFLVEVFHEKKTCPKCGHNI